MTTHIETIGIASMALDPTTGLLGYTTDTGFFRVVDLATGERVESYNLGGALGGFAFADDGSAYIAQVENAAYWTDQEQDGVLHHLDRGEPAVENITWALDYGNSSATDIAIASNGLALVTVTSQWTPLYVLDTATGAISEYVGASYNSYYSPRVTISDGGRYALVQEVGSSGGSVHLWDSQTNTIVAETSNFENAWDNGYGDEDGAVSEAAGLIVQSNLHVYDMQLNGIADLSGIIGASVDEYGYTTTTRWEATAFSADGAFLYALDADRDLLIAIDTDDLSLADAFAFDVPASEDRYTPNVTDMLVAADGRVVVQAADAVVTAMIADLDAPNPVGTADADVLVGSAADDALFGLGGNDALIGARGADTLTGGAGDDELRGGAGDDVLEGGQGHDVMEGGAGADRFVVSANDLGRDEIVGFEMQDVIVLRASTDVRSTDDITLLRVGDDVTVTITDDASLILRDVQGAVSSIQFDVIPVIEGTDGDDRILGTDGDDVMDGRGGDDELFGGNGADEIQGGAGADVIWGDAMG